MLAPLHLHLQMIQRGIQTAEDCTTLQFDLQVIYRWARDVNMHFKGDNSECMRLQPKPSNAPEFDYLGPTVA